MFGKKENICPMLKAVCIKAQCAWFVHVRGKDPQTGADIDFNDCSVKWLPTLLIENSKETRQAAAAIESFRNESVTNAKQTALAICRMVDITMDQVQHPAAGTQVKLVNSPK